MSKITAGQVAITLGDQEYMLKPTLDAMQKISNQLGGLAGARQAIVGQNLQGIVAIITHGANVPSGPARGLPDKVFREGLTDPLLVPLLEYIGLLQNGGRPPEADDGGDASAEGNAEA